MSKIYVPEYNSNKCVVIYNSTTMRVYDERPTSYNRNYNYTDYYYNSHYYFVNGTQQFGTYSTLPTCVDNNLITTDYFYRNDLSEIMIILLVICIFAIYIPIKWFSRFFRRVRI